MRPPEEGRSFGLRWTVRRQHGLVTISLEGELDLASIDAAQEVAEELTAEGPTLVFDLEKLEFIDSTGLRLLGTLQKKAKDGGGRLLLGRISPAVRRVIHIAGLVNFFEYVEGAPAPDVLCSTCDSWVPANGSSCIHCGAPL